MHLNKIRNFINKSKNNNKSMETKMKEKINLDKIEGIRDIDDGIDFVKLPARRRVCGGDFDLIGLKEVENGEYTLVVREVSKSDLNTCRYRSTSYIEKGEYVPILIDQDINIKSILVQFHVGEKFTEVLMDGKEVDVRDEHMHIIRSIISYYGLDEEKKKDYRRWTEEEHINREFGINNLVKIAEGIGKRIDRDRKYITSKDISPILDGLKSTIDYLKSLEPNGTNSVKRPHLEWSAKEFEFHCGLLSKLIYK